MRLVLLETSGNQRYIFTTNRLRENVGASELTYRSGTTWVTEALSELGGPSLPTGAALAESLLDSGVNPPIGPGVVAEVIVAASGKAIILVDSEKTGRALISAVTSRALREAPGLDLTGVMSDEFELGRGIAASQMNLLHRRFEHARQMRTSPTMRYFRLPVVAECASSGLPAAGVETYRDRISPVSTVSAKKAAVRDAGYQRLAASIGLNAQLTELDQVAGVGAWIAVIHADGNGIGRLLIDFEKYAGDDDRAYLTTMREFSVALERATGQAVRDAIASTAGKGAGPDGAPLVQPLVLGGDDVTLVTDAKSALPLTVAFLRAFESRTANEPVLASIAQAALGRDHLTAAAGVAIVRKHYPFWAAYGLAEELLQSAKDASRKAAGHLNPGFSVFDFHALYDTTASELGALRSQLRMADGERLHGRPYVASKLTGESDASGWIGQHAVELLATALSGIARGGEDAPVPNSQVHALRSALFMGAAAADAQFALVRGSYPAAEKLLGSSESLFFDDGDGRATRLLDAVEISEFMKGGLL